MKKVCIGATLGFVFGIIVETLLEFGIEASNAFSMISAFILFPVIYLAGLPWNLLIGENGKHLIAIGGVGIGIIINSTIIGAIIFATRKPRRNMLADSSFEGTKPD